MILNITNLKKTLDISVKNSNSIIGHDDPNFKRIHHHNHHILLYIKDYIMKESCKNYFEIGTHFGHSLVNLLQSKYESNFVSCDLFLNGKTIASDCKIQDVEKLANDNAKRFNKNNYNYSIIKGNSWSPKTKDKVMRLLPNGIDLLFIDGDHRRNAVMSDFSMYFPIVNHGGYIVFDDYLPLVWNGKERDCPKAVNDIVKATKQAIEVIGITQDIVNCNKIKGSGGKNNSCYILKKL